MPSSPEAERSPADDSRALKRLSLAVLGVGALLQLWLSLRSWIYFDQILLYQLGVEGLSHREFFPYAKAVSGSGVIPGALLEILVAAPLLLWFDLRSPIVALGIAQFAAALILWRTTARIFDERAALAFTVVYWLGPWRLYHSGFLWEPTFLLLPAAVHFWASLRLVDEARWLPSFLLGAIAALSVQLHPSGIVLGVSTGLLWIGGRMRLKLTGSLVGAALGSLTLLPTLGALRAGQLPRALPGGGWTDWGLFQVHPLLKDALYWLRISSLDVGRRLRQVDLESPWIWIAGGLGVLGAASVVIALLANVRFLRRSMSTPEQSFARLYSAALLAAHVAAMAFSSVTPQGWHLLVLLHAACLPVALWLAEPSPPSRALRSAAAAFAVLRLPIVLILGLGHPMYDRPASDPNLSRVEEGRLDELELVPIPFGGDASKRGPVPWEADRDRVDEPGASNPRPN